MCLNRYFSAEGVKVQSQKAWKDICGHDGRQLLAKNIEATVKYYQESCKSENYSVREAACHSLREIGVKIEQKIIEPHISSILESLFFCCNDQLWPVSDVAGRFLKEVRFNRSQYKVSKNGQYTMLFINLGV